MRFQVRASVKGQPYDPNAVINGEFNIKLVDNTQVETCSGIELTLTQLTVKNREESRGSTLYHSIPAKGEAAVSTVIPALYVASNKDRTLCPTVTIAQYYDTNSEIWVDVRQDDYNILNMEDQSELYNTFTITQEQYLQDFGWYHANYNDPKWTDYSTPPQSVAIQARFLTWAVADYESTLTEDAFTFNVTSSGETQLTYCRDEFATSLSMTGTMKDRTYQISADEYHADIESYYLQTKFEGQLSPQCQ
jgi:hypothetical protein